MRYRAFVFIIFLCISILSCPFLNALAHDGESKNNLTPVEWSDPYQLSFRGGYPRMATIDGGKLLMVFEGSKELKYSISSEGKHWSTPRIAVSYKNTDYSPANPTPYYDEKTGITYLAYRCPITRESSYEANIAYVKSEDRRSP